MLLNVSLQNGVEMLEFPVSNESYYVDLEEEARNQWVLWADPGQEAVFTWHN